LITAGFTNNRWSSDSTTVFGHATIIFSNRAEIKKLKDNPLEKLSACA
jgi:hypothetical protein